MQVTNLRIPRAIILPNPCKSCVRRQFSLSSSLSVFRPQVPYEAPKARLDPYGFPIRTSPDAVDELAEEDPAWNKRIYDTNNDKSMEVELARMAEPTRLGFYERYGSHDGYGLKNKARWRVNEDGRLEKWEAAGEDWKTRLGFRNGAFRPGVRVEVEGFRHRKSVKLRPSSAGVYRPRLETPWGKRNESVEAIHDPFHQDSRDHVRQPRVARAAPPHITDGESIDQSEIALSEKSSPPAPVHTTPTPPRLTSAPSSQLPIRRSYSTQPAEVMKFPFDDKKHWHPNKKLTYSAMAGVRALHESDPIRYDRKNLAKHFGISFEAVTRILKSKWRSQSEGISSSEPVPALGLSPLEKKSISGTKWDKRPDTSPRHSPVHALRKVYGGL